MSVWLKTASRLVSNISVLLAPALLKLIKFKFFNLGVFLQHRLIHKLGDSLKSNSGSASSNPTPEPKEHHETTTFFI
jgi:hypothetical protein